MEKQIFFAWSLNITVLLSLLSAEQSSGSFFSSLQFTRDALMDFSRGSQRTVEIKLEPKKTTKMVNKTYQLIAGQKESRGPTLVEVKESENNTGSTDWFSTLSSEGVRDLFDPSMRKHLPKQILVTTQVNSKSDVKTLLFVPFNKTVVKNQTKHELYRTRTSPSNKFMKAINDIELAQTNANASDVKYSSAALAKLKVLVERAIRSKSYKYARRVTKHHVPFGKCRDLRVTGQYGEHCRFKDIPGLVQQQNDVKSIVSHVINFHPVLSDNIACSSLLCRKLYQEF